MLWAASPNTPTKPTAWYLTRMDALSRSRRSSRQRQTATTRN
nr:MAG TPA: hypothetical protein [Caudoviricetes sp.]